MWPLPVIRIRRAFMHCRSLATKRCSETLASQKYSRERKWSSTNCFDAF
jgi:hypothetical protein